MTEDEHHLSPAQEERNRRVDLEIENSRMALLDAQPLAVNPLGAWGFAPGSYNCFCAECGNIHLADKRAWRCLPCAEKKAETTAALLAQAREEGRIAGLREAARVAENERAALDLGYDTSEWDQLHMAAKVRDRILSLIPAGVEKEAGE